MEAITRTEVKLPIVIRLTGTNEAQAKEILKSARGLTSAESMDDAVQQAIKLAMA